MILGILFMSSILEHKELYTIIDSDILYKRYGDCRVPKKELEVLQGFQLFSDGFRVMQILLQPGKKPPFY